MYLLSEEGFNSRGMAYIIYTTHTFTLDIPTFPVGCAVNTKVVEAMRPTRTRSAVDRFADSALIRAYVLCMVASSSQKESPTLEETQRDVTLSTDDTSQTQQLARARDHKFFLKVIENKSEENISRCPYLLSIEWSYNFRDYTQKSGSTSSEKSRHAQGNPSTRMILLGCKVCSDQFKIV